MRPVIKAFLMLVALIIVVGAVAFWYFVSTGVSARERPGAVEEFLATRVRNMAIARHAKSLTSPVPPTVDTVAEGRGHFADHCAICHGNDGSGDTEVGRNLYPKAPDMRLAATQSLSDGELFWIIENGVRFTGMPAWSHGNKESENESWHLVHFIRRLPSITPEELKEMETLNPKSPAEMADEQPGKDRADQPTSKRAPHKH